VPTAISDPEQLEILDPVDHLGDDEGVTTAASDVTVVGRAVELDRLAGWLEAGAGSPIAAISGPGGIGKSVLLRTALARAEDEGWAVLSATAVEGETGLAHVTLADLLRAVPPEQFVQLAPECREVLEVIGTPADTSIDERSVVNAFASLLSAWRGRVLLAVDDVQWLDDQSATAILYAARRASGDAVRFVFTRREEEPQPIDPSLRDRTMVMRLGPLRAQETRALVRGRIGSLDRETMGAVVGGAAGNPLFAIELAALLSEPGARMRVPTTIVDLLRERLGRLTVESRRALLAVALSPGARTSEVVAVVGIDPVDQALAAGVLERRGEVLRPSHPLLGTAVLDDSEPDQQRDLNRRLADAITDDLRHWLHAARSIAIPDSAIAEQISEAGARAGAMGRRRTAAELAEHALRLTPAGSDDRDRRLIGLAEACSNAGNADRALDLLDDIPRLSSPELRARGWLLRTDLAPVSLSELESYVDQAATEMGDDPALRALVLVERCAFAGRGWLTGLAAAESGALEALALAGDDHVVRRRVLFDLAWVRADRCRPVDDLLAAERALPSAATPPIVYSVHRVSLIARMWRGDLETAQAGFEELLVEAEERGESESVMVTLIQLAEIAVRAGRWDDADRYTDQIGNSQPFQDVDPGVLRLRALAAVGRGDVDTARELAERSVELSRTAQVLWQEFEAQRALAQAALLSGDAETAHRILEPMWDHLQDGGFVEPGAFPFAVDLAEALVTVGGDEAVARAKRIATALRAVVDHRWAEAAAHAIEGHVALASREDEVAVSAFESAAAMFGEIGFRLDQARSLRHAGVVARRRRKLRDAKRLLTEAVAVFDEIGSRAWAEQARSELARVGGRPSSGSALTETERRVAILVAQGNRNRDVAKALFVTESTVEATLSRIYAKLGVRSRTELSARMRRL
jgi:ATP/maltotriose-dependent transcriptional regulator MalT